MERLLDLLQEAGRSAEVLQWAEKWIALGQRPEPAYRALMLAHAAHGDMSKVAASYERCVKTLRDFGVEPSEQTQVLYEQIKSGKVLAQTPRTKLPEQARLPEEPKSPSAASVPVPLTSFIGRDHELKKIAELLTSSRLLTLTGPGGVGKTRLAIEAARASVKKFKDGVFWVSLAALSDETLIAQEIAQVLHVRELVPEPMLTTLIRHLQAKSALLVLDNCEHLIHACAQIAEQLLAACPGVCILATSMEGLGLFNERVWQVPSLPLPQGRGAASVKELQRIESIKLFEERALNAHSAFVLDERNAEDVVQICKRLDGIPLAIELAAARIKVLSVQEIAARLDDRFSLLTAGSRTAIPRHQTLRATIDWSHDLLSEPERVLFRRLSVFAGGFSLEAAEAICVGDLSSGGLLDSLGRVVDKSLVVVGAAAASGETRYHLLETIRQYALEKLVAAGEAPDIRGRHMEFYLDLAEAAETQVFGSDSASWFRRLDKELDNIRSAIEWSTATGRAELALRILGALVYFWFAHGLSGTEWNDLIQAALKRPEGMQRTLARAKALNGVGFMYWADEYPMERRGDLEEALSIGRERGDPWNIATALRSLGLFETIAGNYPAARTLLEESVEIWRQMGPPRTLAGTISLTFLGDLALQQNENERARALYEESISDLTQPSDLNFHAYAVRRLAQLAWRAGDYERAFDLCEKSMRLNQEVADPRGLCACLAGFAAIAVCKEDYETGATLAAAVDGQLAAIGIRLLYLDRLEFEHSLAELRAHLPSRKLERLWAKGTAMPFEEVIAVALGGTV
jgi:non-specific serine/threonine protein kinase